MTAIEAAHLEATGKGQFALNGRAITFRTNAGVMFQWSAKTDKEAASQLRLFRAAPKYATQKV